MRTSDPSGAIASYFRGNVFVLNAATRSVYKRADRRGRMRRLAVYGVMTCVVMAFMYQHHVAGQINTVKQLAPDVYLSRRRSAREGTLQQRLGDLRRLRAGGGCQLPLRRAGSSSEDQGADQQADPVRVRHPPSRRSRLRQSDLGGQRSRGGRARKRPLRDAEVRDRVLRRQAGTLGGRGEGARRSPGEPAEAAVTALPRRDDLRRRQAPGRAAILRRRAHAGRRVRVAPQGEDPVYR